MSPKSIRLIAAAVGRDDHVVVVGVVVDHLPRQRVEARPQLVEVAQRVRDEARRRRRGQRRRLQHVPAVRPALGRVVDARRAPGRCARRSGPARAAASGSHGPASAHGVPSTQLSSRANCSPVFVVRPASSGVPACAIARSWKSSSLRSVPGACSFSTYRVAVVSRRKLRSRSPASGRRRPRDAEQISRDPLRLGRCHARSGARPRPVRRRQGSRAGTRIDGCSATRKEKERPWNPRRSSKRLAAEIVGTFGFFFIGFTSIAAGAPGPIGFGFGLFLMIAALGHISGGHFNPAVTRRPHGRRQASDDRGWCSTSSRRCRRRRRSAARDPHLRRHRHVRQGEPGHEAGRRRLGLSRR